MRRFHLILGLLLFIVFVVTGRFMRADFPDKEIIDQELRILMRSRHIYILFAALMNILIGLYFQALPRRPQKIVQYLGSAVLSLSALLLIWAFVQETYTFHHFSDLSRYGIYGSLAGVVLHFLAHFERPSK